MLTFYDTNILMKLEKIYKIAVKKLVFFQRMQKIPKFNFFLLKKPMQITNKTRQGLGKHHRTKTVPKNENWYGLKETKFKELEEKKRGIYQYLTVIIECLCINRNIIYCEF